MCVTGPPDPSYNLRRCSDSKPHFNLTMARSSHDEDSEGSASGEGKMQVESLVAGRQRRSTAGTRMNTLLADEEEDDELKLLFAETGEEEDMEFDEDGADTASDVDMGSSSDEDQGPTAGAEDMEGEKEVEKAEREERRKKRKAQETFKGPRASKAKTMPEPREAGGGGTSAPAPRPKKKSERLSWLPTPEEGPVRQSSRKQTMENKQLTHQRMREHQKRRERQVESMEEARKYKEDDLEPEMTQDDRLAEAAKAEARNAKSLNRWEAAEEKRVEEQRAKIAALKNRTLDGPVISWWSGPAKWLDGKLVATGRKVFENMNEPIGRARIEEEAVADAAMADVPLIEAKHNAEVSAITSPTSAEKTRTVPSSTTMLSATNESYGSQTQSQQLQGYQGRHPGPDLLSPFAPVPILLPVVEVAARNLVVLNNIDANASRLPQLQDHVLLRKKGQAKPSSEYLFSRSGVSITD